ncbi:hydrolase [Mesobacillus subterraneus]|uniref:hydrolase n=1 Tax=Mesobacillus subterraneus TaxID=285983 RepID=UPI00273FB85D|nr:hydrolase [Mesobacillus subterraneus]WLR53914.1 hydrolase [Mesobacillus subterraneus]
MEETKQKYYFNIESGEVLDTPAEPEVHLFTLIATGEEIKDLREYLMENYKADLATLANSNFRPFTEPDREHAEYDFAMKEIYAMVYKLGDAEARNHVKSMGIFSEDELTGI